MSLPPLSMFFLLALTSFGLSLGKSFQTQNIIFNNHWGILPTSYFISFMEIYIIVKVSSIGIGWILIPLGLGGAVGCWLSMYAHKRLFKNKEDKDGK